MSYEGILFAIVLVYALVSASQIYRMPCYSRIESGSPGAFLAALDLGYSRASFEIIT
jgi:hypothetical protein